MEEDRAVEERKKWSTKIKTAMLPVEKIVIAKMSSPVKGRVVVFWGSVRSCARGMQIAAMDSCVAQARVSVIVQILERSARIVGCVVSTTMMVIRTPMRNAEQVMKRMSSGVGYK